MKKRTKGRVKKFEESYGLDGGSQRQIRKPRKKDTPKPEKTRKNSRINKSRIILTVIVILLITVLGMSVKNIFELQAENKALKEENKALTTEKETLEDEYANVNDPEYIEEQARIQLKLIKPGEILYILEDQEKEDEAANEEEN